MLLGFPVLGLPFKSPFQESQVTSLLLAMRADLALRNSRGERFGLLGLGFWPSGLRVLAFWVTGFGLLGLGF